MGPIIDTHEGSVGKREGAVAAPLADVEAWNTTVFSTLGELLGQAKIDGIASRFQSDLQARFSDRNSREILRRDAHTITSTAGLLGFASLSAAAKTLELNCVRGDDFTRSLSALLRCRETVGDLLAQHLGSH